MTPTYRKAQRQPDSGMAGSRFFNNVVKAWTAFSLWDLLSSVLVSFTDNFHCWVAKIIPGSSRLTPYSACISKPQGWFSLVSLESHVYFWTSHCGQGEENVLIDGAELAMGSWYLNWECGRDNLPQKNWDARSRRVAGCWSGQNADATCSRVSTFRGCQSISFSTQSESWEHKLRWFPHLFLIRDQCWIIFHCVMNQTLSIHSPVEEYLSFSILWLLQIMLLWIWVYKYLWVLAFNSLVYTLYFVWNCWATE